MDSVGAGTFGKPLLVELSRGVERFALADGVGGPSVVIAMFQELSYFRSAAEVYRRIAASGAVTVVGFRAGAPQLPDGVRHVVLDDDDLLREWSVTVLGPRGGASLVAADLQTLEPGARTLEEGRTFRAGWSFRRDEALRQVLRLRAKLPWDPSAAADVDAVVRAVAAAPEPAHQAPWEESLRFLADRLHTAINERAALAARLAAVPDPARRDPHTGFETTTSLEHWIAGSTGATLPIGLVLVQLVGLSDLRRQHGRRAELAALTTAGATLRDLTGDGDRLVVSGPEELLVVRPSAEADDVLRLCNALSRLTSRLEAAYPFVPLPVRVAGTVTRSRPLPVVRIRQHAAPGHRTELVPG